MSGRLTALVLSLLVSFADSVRSDEGPPYLEHTIEVESRRSGVVWGRIDGDERLDLLSNLYFLGPERVGQPSG